MLPCWTPKLHGQRTLAVLAEYPHKLRVLLAPIRLDHENLADPARA